MSRQSVHKLMPRPVSTEVVNCEPLVRWFDPLIPPERFDRKHCFQSESYVIVFLWGKGMYEIVDNFFLEMYEIVDIVKYEYFGAKRQSRRV